MPIAVAFAVAFACAVAFGPWRICLKCSFQCRQVSAAKTWATAAAAAAAAGSSGSRHSPGNWQC